MFIYFQYLEEENKYSEPNMIYVSSEEEGKTMCYRISDLFEIKVRMTMRPEKEIIHPDDLPATYFGTNYPPKKLTWKISEKQ